MKIWFKCNLSVGFLFENGVFRIELIIELKRGAAFRLNSFRRKQKTVFQ